MGLMRIVGVVALAGSVATVPTTPARAASPAGALIYSHGIPGRVEPCSSCHGTQGQGLGEFPRLAGLPAHYLVQQLLAFRNGTRSNGLMQTIAKGLDPSEMNSLGHYAAGLSAPYLPPPSVSAAALASGARLVTLGAWSRGVPACRDCHGPSLQGGGPAIPPLAGQPESYLVAQLEAYQKGRRPRGPLGLMARIANKLNPAEARAASTYVASLRPGEEAKIPRGEKSHWKPHAQNPASFAPPPESALPPRPEDAKAILLGESIFTDTPKYAARYVGNSLSCRNCHTDRGRNPLSAPIWAAVPKFPQYRAKNRLVNTLAMRIDGCFRYSENGTPPPPDSREMVALLSYARWLATGLPIGITPEASGYPKLPAPVRKPDRSRGKTVYATDCAVCHGKTGQGRLIAGAQVIPPLWGPRSFNWGAGMHAVNKAAAFIFNNMPLGAVGTLTAQQAWDVAAWLDSQPRPQDPRFTGSVEKTQKLFHKKHEYDFYGQTVDGMTLGAPGTLKAWEKTNTAGKGR